MTKVEEKKEKKARARTGTRGIMVVDLIVWNRKERQERKAFAITLEMVTKGRKDRLEATRRGRGRGRKRERETGCPPALSQVQLELATNTATVDPHTKTISRNTRHSHVQGAESINSNLSSRKTKCTDHTPNTLLKIGMSGAEGDGEGDAGRPCVGEEEPSGAKFAAGV